MKDILSKLLKSTALLILIGILSIIILLIVILSKCASNAESDIIIEETPNAILKVLPKNDLYVFLKSTLAYRFYDRRSVTKSTSAKLNIPPKRIT